MGHPIPLEGLSLWDSDPDGNPESTPVQNPNSWACPSQMKVFGLDYGLELSLGLLLWKLGLKLAKYDSERNHFFSLRPLFLRTYWLLQDNGVP